MPELNVSILIICWNLWIVIIELANQSWRRNSTKERFQTWPLWGNKGCWALFPSFWAQTLNLSQVKFFILIFINRCRTSQIEEELTKKAISKETTLRNRDFWALIPVLTKICFKIYIFKTKNFCNDLCKMRMTQEVKKLQK